MLAGVKPPLSLWIRREPTEADQSNGLNSSISPMILRGEYMEWQDVLDSSIPPYDKEESVLLAFPYVLKIRGEISIQFLSLLNAALTQDDPSVISSTRTKRL